MEKRTQILIGILAILAISAIVYEGSITGNATAQCSKNPKITYIEQIGDSISVNWEDTSTFEGIIKYETLLLKKDADGNFDINVPFKATSEKQNFASFNKLDQGDVFIVKIRAKNQKSCPLEYTDYVTSEEIPIDLRKSIREYP